MISKACVIAIILALCFNTLDFVTGFFNAWKLHSISSKKMREGLFHKFGFIFLYILCVLIEVANVQLNLNFPVNILYAVVSYVILTEIISILENIGKINPSINIDDIKDKINK